jgi:hypothetical protein
MGNARSQHSCLASASAGKHEKRTIERLDRLALLLVERIEIMARPLPHGALRDRAYRFVLFWRGKGSLR